MATFYRHEPIFAFLSLHIAPFPRNESVLTGAPAKLADVDIVTIPVWDIASDAKDQHAASPVDWELLPSTSPIDVSLLEPVTLASTNVPDLGTAVCFRYRVSERNLGSFWWPKSGGGSVSSSASSLGDPSRASDECDPLALNLTLPIARIQPILVALLKCMQFFLLHWRFHLAHRESVQDVFHAVQPIVNWIKCLATRPLFPWLRAVDRIRVPLPHWLVAVECQIAGEMLLLCGQVRSFLIKIHCCSMLCPYFSVTRNPLAYLTIGQHVVEGHVHHSHQDPLHRGGGGTEPRKISLRQVC